MTNDCPPLSEPQAGGSIGTLDKKLTERSDYHHYSLVNSHLSFWRPSGLPMLIKCRIFSFIWSRWLCQEKSTPEFQFLIKSNSLIVTITRICLWGSGLNRLHMQGFRVIRLWVQGLKSEPQSRRIMNTRLPCMSYWIGAIIRLCIKHKHYHAPLNGIAGRSNFESRNRFAISIKAIKIDRIPSFDILHSIFDILRFAVSLTLNPEP
jgi:hypothetical protein